MKYFNYIVAGLLGLAFIAGSIVYFFDLAPAPPFPKGSPIEQFMAAMIPTGYMTFVKSCELLGGILVAIPRTRNLGLLFLGPVILNIIAFHAFVAKAGLFDPPLILISLIALYLLWLERHAFITLVTRKPIP
jgi:putative oxidoreductase